MRKSIIILAGLAVAAISCNKEAQVEQISDEIQIAKKVITVSVESPQTKTVLNSERSGLDWTTGDNFRLMTNTAADAHDATTLEYTAGGKFEPEVGTDATEVYAYYYAGTYTDVNHSTPTAYTAYINKDQTQTEAGVLNGQMIPMAAKGTINDDNTVSLDFHQMAGVLALNIYSTEKVSGELINSVKVTPTETGFVGAQYSTDLTADNVIFNSGSSSYTYAKVELETGYDYGTAKPTNKQMFEGQIYLVLAKKNYATLDFEIETNKGTYSITGQNFDLTETDFLPVNINLKKADYEKALANKVFFEETFKDSGSDMSTATGKVTCDNEGWTFANEGGAGDCIKLGTSSKKGTATTPSIAFTDSDAAYINKELTLTFKAVAWSGDQSSLVLSATNANLSSSSVTVNTDQSTWKDFSITLTPTASPVTITFAGKQASKSRFFLDDVKLAYTKGVDAGDDPTPATTPVITISNTPQNHIDAEGAVVTFNYQIDNPVSGVSVSAAPKSEDDWVNTFDYETEGTISFIVDPKTTTGSRTTTITVSYTGAESKTFDITQDGITSGDPTSPTEFSWSATTNTSIDDGSETATDGSGTTVSWAKGTSSSTKVALNTDGMRLYSGSTFTVSNSSKKISKIEFTIKVNAKSSKYPVPSVSLGTLTSITSSSKSMTWEGSSNAIAVSFSSESGNVAISKIVVSYE